MKTTEQKAKAYDEVREKIALRFGSNVAEEIFSEFEMSEDERIKKELIDAVQGLWDNDALPMPLSAKRKDAWIAWLEKQGEQKPATIDIDKMVDNYANNKELGNEEFGKPVPCMIRAYRQGLNDAIGKVVLKPAWSEEDEEFLRRAINAAKDAYPMTAKWLKSLKQRIGG